MFYYFDGNGTKQGPYNSAQLKALAENGSITPDTRVKNEDGRHTKAKNIRGLFPQPVPPPVQSKQHSDTVSPENPPISPPSAAETPCPHCGEPVSAGEKFCGFCGKSVLVPTQPCLHCGATVAVGRKVCYVCGEIPDCENDEYGCGYTETCGFLDIKFTRFVTPVWISVIWIICIVSNVISFLASLGWIGMIAIAVDDIAGILVFILGFLASIILHLLSLLLDRIVLEVVMVLFRIERNTRATRPKRQ